VKILRKIRTDYDQGSNFERKSGFVMCRSPSLASCLSDMPNTNVTLTGLTGTRRRRRIIFKRALELPLRRPGFLCNLKADILTISRSRWPRCLRRRSAVAWLLGSRVRIPLGAWMFVSCLYVVLSCVGRGLCDGLITRPEESYRVHNCVWLRNLKGGQGPI
jgi:hypothetical protein